MARANWLISSIEPELWPSISRDARKVDLRRGDILQVEGEPVEQVYFPESALIALLSSLPTGELVAAAMVGWDGALGVFEACGSKRATSRARVQVDGAAWCMRAADYRRAFERSEELREHVHKYIELLLMESRQYVACNALHPVEARLCRSVLEALDRSGASSELQMTKEELSQLLGVQRTTVSTTISQLQAIGAMESRRGVIEVCDRGELERRACSCWRTIAEARREILGSPDHVCGH